MKYLLVLIVIVIVLALLLGKRRGGGAAPRDRHRGDAPEGMVRCVQCGIHLPRSEALLKSGRTYCSAAHLEQDKAGS